MNYEGALSGTFILGRRFGGCKDDLASHRRDF